MNDANHELSEDVRYPLIRGSVNYCITEKIQARIIDRLTSGIYIFILRLIEGFRHIQGPAFPRFGAGLVIVLRGNSILRFGRISARRNLALLCVGGNITIADDVFINQGCTFNAMIGISIGRNTLFGENVKIFDFNHEISSEFIASPDTYSVAPVSIGENCWIGSNVVILKGVTICDRVVIGANAVVSKSIDQPGIYVSEGAGKLRRL